MDTQITTFGRKRSCSISFCGALIISAIFLFGFVTSGIMVYHFAPCLEEKQVKTCNNFQENSIARSAKSLPAIAKPNMEKIDVRLPKSIVPVEYDLKLIPFIWEGNFTFNGEVEILVNITSHTKNVTLHAIDMKIDEEFTNLKEYIIRNGTKLNETPMIRIEKQENDTLRQFYIIHTIDQLQSGKQYLVHLKFIGYINDYLQGFYRSSYMVGNQTRWIATTQFQPTDARRAFPCFDEPALKARFQISIARPNNMTSISNMPRKSEPYKVSRLPTYLWDHYQQSVPMSTYLVAFIVCDFEVLRTESGKFGVWARKEAINQSRYSLDIGPKVLRYFEDYFQIKFPLPKIDMVALPDFSAGAMENWGLITYRETAMLYEKGVSTNSNQQRVATVVSHELAHQWFGNLVTPSWWTDLWLNEGFASYVEYIGMNAVEPMWKVLEQFVVHELQNVFGLDALESSHPISIEVGNPDEISEIFDRISYGKGASIIRMMDHFLTTEVFKRGLTNYLNQKSYHSAEQNDLWDTLTKQAHTDGVLSYDLTVKQIMDTWTLQSGFPVVTVMRNYERRDATLTQERFVLQNNTKVDTSYSKYLWWIPITYTSEKENNFNVTSPSYWLRNESVVIADLNTSSSQWVIFNIQETGYYRVNYDKTNWQLLIKQLNTSSKVISTINRAQLIDDALNLARAGRLDYITALDLTSYLVYETEYLPWKSALTAFSYLDTMLIKSPGYDKFRIHILKLLHNVYKQIGFKDTVGDPQLTVFTRIDVLSWACSFGHDDCVQNAVTQFRNWRNSSNPNKNNPISPNLKSVVYCTAIRVGSQVEWDFAWQRYIESNVGSEKDLLLNALGCTREIWILSRYLDWAVTENSGIRKQDAARVFGAVANNIVGQPLTFNYLRNEWSRLKKYFGASLLTINNIVKSSIKRINTKYELDDLMKFATEHWEELGTSKRTIQQSMEQAEANIRWLNRNHAVIYNWLQ